MNRAKGGGWEFLDHLCPPRLGFTYTGASGCNIVTCAVRKRGVCYAERGVKRLRKFCPLCPTFIPHLHDGETGTPDRINEPLERKIPSVIAPVSTGDLFGLPEDMTALLLAIIEKADWHIFTILTKAPQNAHHYTYPNNVWFGVSINEQSDTWRLDELKKIRSKHKWMIAEPLYSEIDYDLTFLDWIIIGHQTRPELQPERAWVKGILERSQGVPVFMKGSLRYEPLRREPAVSTRARIGSEVSGSE